MRERTPPATASAGEHDHRQPGQPAACCVVEGADQQPGHRRRGQRRRRPASRPAGSGRIRAGSAASGSPAGGRLRGHPVDSNAQIGPRAQRRDVGRRAAPAFSRSVSQPWPGSRAYGWMSIHGRSTKARRWARGCGRVSSGSSLSTGVPSSPPDRDHVHVEGARARTAAPGRGPGRPPPRAPRARSSQSRGLGRRVHDQHHRVQVRGLVGVAPRRRLVDPGDAAARASPSAATAVRRWAAGRPGCCPARAPPGSPASASGAR